MIKTYGAPSMALFTAVLAWLVCGLHMVVAATTGSRMLVVHDAALVRSDYSNYLKALEAQGLELSYRSIKDTTPALFDYEAAKFDHLLLLAPSAKTLPTDLAPQKLVTFLKQNGNILFALSSELSELYRDFAREFELEFEERGTTIVDHFASLPSDDKHTTIAVPATDLQSKLSGLFAGVQPKLPFLYKGIAHRVGASPLAFSVLKPPSTSYSFEVPDDLSSVERLDNPDREAVFGSDADVALISAFQLIDTERRSPDDGPKRQGSAGRAVFTGSLEAFSNAFTAPKSTLQTRQGTDYTGSSNLAVLSALTSWLTQRQGVLRVESTAHSRVKMHDKDVRESYEELDVVDEQGQRRLQRMYRIKDTVTFSIDLVQRTPSSGWVPAPTDLDLQVSLVMLDPYITTNLSATQPQTQADGMQSAVLRADGNGAPDSPRFTRYSSTFQLPDRHGVYTFIVDWKRHGWSYVHTRDTAPVRPFNHDEHPRGLHSAWPYVVGSMSTMVAFLVFVALWVNTQDDERTAEERLRKSK